MPSAPMLPMESRSGTSRAFLLTIEGLTTSSTKIFAYTQSTSQIVQFVGPALSSTAMKQNLRLPFWLGIGCFVLIYPNIAIIPETRHLSGDDQSAQATAESASLLRHSEENEPVTISQHRENGNTDLPQESTPQGGFIQFRLQFREFKTLFTSNPNYGCCLAIFFFNTLQRATLNVLVLYISKRYNTSFATVWLFSLVIVFFQTSVADSSPVRLDMCCPSKPSSTLYSSWVLFQP